MRSPNILPLKYIKYTKTQKNPQSHSELKLTKFSQFFAALKFFATGEYQRGVGESSYTSLSQTKVCLAIKKFSRAMSGNLMQKYVRFPQTDDEITAVKARYIVLF